MKTIISLVTAIIVATIAITLGVNDFFSGWISAVCYHTSGMIYDDIKNK